MKTLTQKLEEFLFDGQSFPDLAEHWPKVQYPISRAQAFGEMPDHDCRKESCAVCLKVRGER